MNSDSMTLLASLLGDDADEAKMQVCINNAVSAIKTYINKDVDVESTQEIWRSMQRNFPNNQVIVIHNAFIDGIDILKERTEFDELLQPFEDCLNS